MIWKPPKLDQFTLLLFGAIFCLLLSISALLMSSDPYHKHTLILSDGVGYYLYLPSAFIHRDLSMEWTKPLQTIVTDYRRSKPEWYGLVNDRPGAYLDRYPIGLAILWTPFFLAAHILSMLTGHPATGFTIWYQAAVGFAAAFYTALGCILIYKLLRRHFSRKVSYFTVLSLLLGTNMLEYATQDSSFTHVYSLFLIAAGIHLTPIWYKHMSYRTSALLALVLGLTTLVRPTNALIVVVLLLWNVTTRPQIQQRLALLWRQRMKLVLMAGVGLAVLFPQLLYWHYITGKWLTNSYDDATFTNILHPQIFNILFSTDHGVFFWAPVLLPALLGLALLRRHLKEWSIPLYVFLPAFVWLMASWVSWQFGESYGHRAFIDIFPLLALPLATVYSRAKSPTARNVLVVFAGLCIFANLFLTYQYWEVVLPPAGTTMHIYLHVWRLGLISLLNTGFSFGFLGLIALVCMALAIPTHYFLVSRDQTSQRRGASA
jgi:hypothetical protein